MKEIIDYYKGFEGEPEVQFIQKRVGRDLIIRIWEGYFDRIMYKIKPDPEGWTGLALYYHLDEGWYDESPWLIPDLESVIEQF